MRLTNEVKKHQERGNLRLYLKKCREANNFIKEMDFGGREHGEWFSLYGGGKSPRRL